LLVEETMAMWHVILAKRENYVNEKVWKDEKTQEKKNGTRWIFVGILILVIIEDAKGWVNKKKNSTWLNIGLELMRGYNYSSSI